MSAIPPKTEVQRDTRIGVTIFVPPEELPEDKIAVIWYDNEIEICDPDSVTVMGPDEAKFLTKEQARKCGMGQGEKCCIFLMAGDKGLECGRFDIFHLTVVQRRHGMTSKRLPLERYPDCQLKEE